MTDDEHTGPDSGTQPGSAPVDPVTELANVAYLAGRRGSKSRRDKTPPPAQDLEEQPHFRPLGHHREMLHFFSSRKGQVVSVPAYRLSSKPVLFLLAPLRWWETAFGMDEGFKGSSVDAAVDSLIRACYAKGVFVPERLRGRGVWMDEDRVVFHAGDQLVVDGEPVPLADLDSVYVYEAFPAMRVSPDPLEPDQSRAFFRLCMSPRWTSQAYGWQLAGWCVCALIGGTLAWRPHIWITGPSGCGKSWVMREIVQRALGALALAVQGESSSAGIRQTLKQEPLPVVFDEAEGEDEHSDKIIRAVIGLMRLASTEGSGRIVKGGTDGVASAQSVRSCFAIAAINPRLRLAADINRIEVLSLSGGDGSHEDRERFRAIQQSVTELFTEGFAERLLRLVLEQIGTIRANILAFSGAIAERLGSQRQADQLAPLVAGAYALVEPGKAVTDGYARDWVQRLDLEDSERSTGVADELRLLGLICESIVEVRDEQGYSSKLSVSELIHAVHTGQNADVSQRSADKALKRVGLRVEDGRLFVAQSHDGLSKILRNSPWASGWHVLLRRIDGAESAGHVRFSEVSRRAVSVPLTAAISIG